MSYRKGGERFGDRTFFPLAGLFGNSPRTGGGGNGGGQGGDGNGDGDEGAKLKATRVPIDVEPAGLDLFLGPTSGDGRMRRVDVSISPAPGGGLLGRGHDPRPAGAGRGIAPGRAGREAPMSRIEFAVALVLAVVIGAGLVIGI